MDAYIEMGERRVGSHDLIGLLADCLWEGLCTCTLPSRLELELQAHKQHYAFKYPGLQCKQRKSKAWHKKPPLCNLSTWAEVEKISKFNFLHLTEKFNYIIIDRVFQSMLNSPCGKASVWFFGGNKIILDSKT